MRGTITQYLKKKLNGGGQGTGVACGGPNFQQNVTVKSIPKMPPFRQLVCLACSWRSRFALEPT